MIKDIETMLPIVKSSYDWMLEHIKAVRDDDQDLNPGNYSPELTLAIETGKWLAEVLPESEVESDI